MIAKTLIRPLFLSIILATFTQPGLSNQRFEQRIAELTLQTKRFRSFVAAKKFIEAEAPLAILSTLIKPEAVSGLRAKLFLHQQNYHEAYLNLTIYFEGSSSTQKRVVGGAETLRAWYWFLQVQKGENLKADKSQRLLLSQKMVVPDGEEYFEPQLLSNSKTAQVYMYLAAYYSAQHKFYLSEQCINFAKKIDTEIKIDPGFQSLADRGGHKQGVPGIADGDELIPMLDHFVYEKKVGHSAILN